MKNFRLVNYVLVSRANPARGPAPWCLTIFYYVFFACFSFDSNLIPSVLPPVTEWNWRQWWRIRKFEARVASEMALHFDLGRSLRGEADDETENRKTKQEFGRLWKPSDHVRCFWSSCEVVVDSNGDTMAFYDHVSLHCISIHRLQWTWIACLSHVVVESGFSYLCRHDDHWVEMLLGLQWAMILPRELGELRELRCTEILTKSHILVFSIFSSYVARVFPLLFNVVHKFAEISLNFFPWVFVLRRSRHLRLHIYNNTGSTVAGEDGDSPLLLGLLLVDGIANLPECYFHWWRGHPGSVAFIYLSLVHLSRRDEADITWQPCPHIDLFIDAFFVMTGDITVATFTVFFSLFVSPNSVATLGVNGSC